MSTMASPRRLPIITIGKKHYYVDLRLRQLRNVKNPHEFIDPEPRAAPDEEVA